MSKKRLTKEQKIERAQIEVECNSLSDRAVAEIVGVGASTVKDWRNKYGWNKGKTAQIADDAAQKKFSANQELEEKTADLSAQHRAEVYNRSEYTERMLLKFDKSTELSQTLADKLLMDAHKEKELKLTDIDVHSRITGRNKETALGKNPDTAIQINNDKQPAMINIYEIDGSH